MTKFIGKTEKLTAVLGAYDHNLRKLCLEDVRGDSGFYKDHMWVNYTKRLSFNHGTKLAFTARVTQYLGLDKGDNQINKVGLTNLRNVKKVTK